MKVVLFLSAIILAAYASSDEEVARRWTRRNGVYLSGYTSGRKFYPNLGQALRACSHRRGCGGVTYERRHRRYSLRRGRGFRRSPSGEISWLMGPAISGLRGNEARVEDNVDYWGADIRSFRSRGLRDCYNACRRQKGCMSFTMRKRDHYCWLKRRHNGARRMTNRRHLVSANLVMRRVRSNMNSLRGNEARVENNVDYWGADIRSFRSRGLRDCYNACRRQRGCRSFTMRKRDNYCWLKKRHNGARRMTNRRHLVSANLFMRRARSARFAAMTARWAAIPGRLTRISKGRAGVWGVNRYQNIYVLNSNGRSWTHVAGKLVQISSGSQVWGVNRHDYIYRYLGNNRWQRIPGRLMNIDVSDNGSVWGISRDQKIWRWTGKGWQHIGGRAIQVTVGPAGVWVINRNHDIFYRRGTYGDPNSAGNGWIHIPGKLKWGSSGGDLYVGVNRNNDIFYRKGISAKRPTGTNWVHVPGKLMQIEIYGDQVVGTNPGHVIFKAPVVGAFSHTLRPSEGRIENNVDYWGADIRSFTSKGIRDCYNACKRQRGCVSFTMRKANNYCWLKKRYNGARRTVNKRSLLSVNMARHVAARALKMRRMKVYRSYIVRYKRAAAIQRKRLRGYTLRYNKAHAAAVINARWTNKMVKLANANARAANVYHRRYTIYRRKFMAVRAGCIKAQRKWAGVANAQVKAQRVMIARMKVYRKKAALYKRRYLASLKLFRTRAKQRKAAYALYNKYIRTSNYWVRRYNVVARG